MDLSGSDREHHADRLAFLAVRLWFKVAVIEESNLAVLRALAIEPLD